MGHPETNPYAPSDFSVTSLSSAKGLLCPYCQHRYRLTWARYLAEPIRGYRCPFCHATAKLHRPDGYVTRIVCLTTLEVIAGFAGALAAYYAIGWCGLVIGGLAAILFIFDEDRRYDENRTLVRAENDLEPSGAMEDRSSVITNGNSPSDSR